MSSGSTGSGDGSGDERNSARRARIAELRAAEQAKARQRRTYAVIGAVVLAALVAGGIAWAVSDSDSGSGSSTKTASGFCGDVVSGSPNGKQWKTAPAMSIDTAATYTATLKTSCGDVTLKLNAKAAPVTVNSFVFLAGQDYFDHTKCHRLTTSGLYVLQCGDPTGTGSGTPGYSFPDENLTGATYPAGTVAMANSGPNTNGSQFFLVYKDTQLPPSYTPFGTITGGLDILTRIAADGTADGGGDGAPKDTVVINSVPVAKQG
ncbi:peptidylprolyl isomerase [Streptacidiphilus cavernicola]|uniref:Peptidyl-prolyl cis-trans isomerase n=1 Tax=Streptacidiphilus cavernicola TaxID=3342716 RepID=A0ABV6VRX3_9ACTN